jgi:hypothetical protein
VTLNANAAVLNSLLIAPTVNSTTLNGNLNSYVVTVNTSVIPAANNQSSLGTTNNWFGNAYVQNISVSNVLTPSSNLSANLGTSTKWFNNTYTNQLSVGPGGLVVGTGGIMPSANLAVNIGSSSLWFNNIYGTAIHALYADLAERFEADAEYEPGTVVELGGPAEITQVATDLSDSVFGVISTNAAYLMNSRAGTNKTHPPIAVQGRVPVKVTGTIRKGDRLVSAGNGLARAGKRSELTTWNVIGRALEDKTTTDEGTIEAVVKLNS